MLDTVQGSRTEPKIVLACKHVKTMTTEASFVTCGFVVYANLDGQTKAMILFVSQDNQP